MKRFFVIAIFILTTILITSLVVTAYYPPTTSSTQTNPVNSIPEVLDVPILAHKGKLVMLRVHDVGTGYGPVNNYLDVEVVIKLDSDPTKAYGFQLRNDNNRPVRQGMLDLLRDAFYNNWVITIEEKGGIVFRVILSK